MKVAIISDVHGNKEALESVIDSFSNDLDGIVLLGDVVDYGPHSNEVISILQGLDYPIICNILGNHEHSILSNSYGHFSSNRGIDSARYTRSCLTENSWDYLQNSMTQSGKHEFLLAGKSCLAVHGSIEDEYWKAIVVGQKLDVYRQYEYVFSGHSHFSHVFEQYYPCDNTKMRNKKKTVFINPGSVGQPRNHNPNAQYAVLNLDTGEVQLKCVPYDVLKEQQAFSGETDRFYRDRLEVGV